MELYMCGRKVVERVTTSRFTKERVREDWEREGQRPRKTLFELFLVSKE
jgi:hypothetical protein